MKALKLFVAAAALLSSIGASAQTCDGGTVASPNPSFSDLNVAPGSMTGCIGFFEKNQFNGQDGASTLATVNTWLTAQGATAISGSGIETTALGGAGNNQISFGSTLFGDTLVGLHWGNYGNNTNANVTAFYLFDAGTAGLDSITLNVTGGWSNAFLYSTEVAPPIPEPETYALMLAGLGAVGLAARRRKARGG